MLPQRCAVDMRVVLSILCVGMQSNNGLLTAPAHNSGYLDLLNKPMLHNARPRG